MPPTLPTIAEQTHHRQLPIAPPLHNTDRAVLPPPPPSPITPTLPTNMNDQGASYDNNHDNHDNHEATNRTVNENVTLDMNIVDEIYDKLKTLTNGMEYDASSWLLLANKALVLVSSKEFKLVNKMKLADRIVLICHLTIMYLDEETNISDDLLDIVADTLPHIINNWIYSYKSNKKTHTKTQKTQRKANQLIAKKPSNIIAEETITPARIEELLITRIEAMTTRGAISNFADFQSKLPEVVVMSIKVVDKYSHLNSSEKRKLIVQTLSYILSEKTPDWFNLTDVQSRRADILAISLPTLVETTTSLVNGDIPEKLDFKELAPLATECIRSLFTICRK